MEKMVLVSMTLFAIAATAFLVIFAVVYLVFTAKHIKGRVRGRGPFGLFAQPRHTFAQYDDEGKGEGMTTEEVGGAKTGRGDRQESG